MITAQLATDDSSCRVLRYLLSCVLLLSVVVPLLSPAISHAAEPEQAPAGLEPGPTDLGIAEYRQDFSVSAEKARAILEVQSDGAGIVELLRQTLGSSYAGVWFDHSAGEFVIPLLTNVDRAELKEALAALDLSAYRFDPARHSWQALENQQQSLLKSPVVQELGAEEVRTTLEPRLNTVAIESASDLPAEVEARLQAIAERLSAATWRPLKTPRINNQRAACRTYNPRVCDAPLRGGVALGARWKTSGGENASNTLCTAGFKAHGLQFGDRFILTAGHCYFHAPAGATWTSEISTGFERDIGPFAGHVLDQRGDFGQIRANNSLWDTAAWASSAPKVAHFWGDQEFPIYYEAWSYPGQYVCISGMVSGTSCANVQRIRVQAPGYPPQGELLGACVRKGDSGGPVFDYGAHTALGLITEVELGPPPCTGRSYYQEITDATSMMGVSVGTRIGGPPVATTGGADNSQPRQVTVYGTVNPNQVSTKFHFEFGQTTAYGRVAPWPAADAGHGGAISVGAVFANLLPNETYNYRLVAQSPAGVSHGSNASVTTKAVPPVVTTKPATGISGTAATLNATINPEGAPTTYYFEYGPSPGYGLKTAEASAGSGRSPVQVSLPVSGLEFGANYQFRVVAKSSGGASTGTTHSFTPGWRKTTTLQIPSGLEPPVNGPDVDCAAVHFCLAVGSAEDSSESVHAFSSLYDGTKWTPMLIPQAIAGNDKNLVSDVSCITPTDCRAIGMTWKTGSSGIRPIVAQWNGSTWQSSAISNPPGMPAILPDAIACPTANFCLVVGSFYDANGIRKEVYLKWDGTSWTYPPSPPSEGATYAAVTSVDCVSASYCFATGFYRKANGEWVVFVNRWDGSGWTREVVKTYMGDEQLHRLGSMSCPGPTLCVGAGVSTTGGKNVPLLGKTNGAGWTLTSLTGIPLPTDKSSSFGSVVCGSETMCEGVGSVENASGELVPVAARMRPDGSWQRQILPELAPERSTLNNLSCASPTYCMAVGARGGYFDGMPIAALYAK